MKQFGQKTFWTFIHFFYIDIKEILIAILAICLLILFIPVFTYFYFAQDLTSKEAIMNRKDTGLVLLDDQDRPFFTFYQAKTKTFIPISQIPKWTQQSVISSEDKDFYKHTGFSIPSIARSFVLDLKQGQLAYGGSTITEQLVKNSLLVSNKSFLRKYQELVLASEIERRYSKDEILEMYLNSVYFGEGAFGIEEASQTYFGKDASDLNISESAMLAALLPAPSMLSPLSNDSHPAVLRQQIILAKMHDQGYINQSQLNEFKSQNLTFATPQDNVNKIATHFALMVRQELIDRFGEEAISRSGFKVRTSLNLDWQKYAEEVVASQVASLQKDKVSNGAAVAIDPKTGLVRALVGSKDWYNNDFGKVNLVTSPRQPGSSFKPLVYSAAMEEGLITPSTVLHDTPTTFPGYPTPYKPVDYDHRYRGLVTARRALSNSLNIPSVEVMQKVGVPKALEMAKRLGISTLGDDPSAYGLSLVLGAGEVNLEQLTDAYAVFADQGQYNPPVLVTDIEDKYGNSIYHYQPNPQPVLEPEVAFLISSILSDSKTRREEFGNTLDVPITAAVKTGTTENYRDAWTIGYTPNLVVGAWVGNNDGSYMDQVAGSLGAAPIWKSLITKFTTENVAFATPSGVVKLAVCRTNGLPIKQASSSANTDYFLASTPVTNYCNASSSAVLAAQSILQSPTPQPASPQTSASPIASDKVDHGKGPKKN